MTSVFLLQGQIQRQLNWLEADLIKVKFSSKTESKILDWDGEESQTMKKVCFSLLFAVIYHSSLPNSILTLNSLRSSTCFHISLFIVLLCLFCPI